MFYCQFCEISKNTFFYRTPPVAASEKCLETVFVFSVAVRGYRFNRGTLRLEENEQLACYFSWGRIFLTCLSLKPVGWMRIKLFRSCNRRCSIKKGVLKNFAKCTGKHLHQSLFFFKVAALRPATLLKKRLWHGGFPVNFANFSRTPFLQNTSGRLLLIVGHLPREFPTCKVSYWLRCKRNGSFIFNPLP